MMILAIIAVLFFGLRTMTMPAYQGGGFIPELLMLIGGGLYVIILGGMLYLFLGVYQNTMETNRLLKRLIDQK